MSQFSPAPHCVAHAKADSLTAPSAGGAGVPFWTREEWRAIQHAAFMGFAHHKRVLQLALMKDSNAAAHYWASRWYFGTVSNFAFRAQAEAAAATAARDSAEGAARAAGGAAPSMAPDGNHGESF